MYIVWLVNCLAYKIKLVTNITFLKYLNTICKNLYLTDDNLFLNCK